MKTLVFILVLANLLFLAYTEGYFGQPENPDAARVHQQLNPERIRVVSRGEPPRGEPPPGKSAERKDKEAAVAKVEAPEVCLAWSGLSAKQADRLATLLSDKFGDFKLAGQAIPAEGDNWWVYIPPLPGKPEADKKAGELKRLGVSDYFIIQDAGPNRYAISLGVFSHEERAGERLADLQSKGVKSAKVGPRNGKDALHFIEARGSADRESSLREAVVALLPDSHSQACRSSQ